MTDKELIEKALNGDEKAIWYTAIIMLEMLACKTKKPKYQKRARTLLDESKERNLK